ncbi:MAG TPA: hypothetical protein VMW87_15625 [Spirochaetia bacterium]|nr:hypothetical protein [Spirochaetia bacterium]
MIRTAIEFSEITPQESVPLLGYGDRTHDSVGIHDELSAYCWWLQPEKGEPFAWVVLDLCLLSIPSVQALSELVAIEAGIAPDQIFLSTTHTHSGPDVRRIAVDNAGWAVRYRELLVRRIAMTISRARERAVPSRIEIRPGLCGLGVNRRDSTRPVDTRLFLLSLVDESGSVHGQIFHYSCHLTVLGVDNYQISADWVGPVRESIQKESGAPLMYIQGAEGNVDPVCRGGLDMADPDQAIGSSFEIMNEMARDVTASIQSAAGCPPISTATDVKTNRFLIEMPLRYGKVNRQLFRSRIQKWKQGFAAFLAIPEEEVPEDWSINSLIKERCRNLCSTAETTRHWVAEQFAYGAFLSIYGGSDSLARPEAGIIPITAAILDFGGLVILGMPVEALVEIAFDWQSRFADTTALICGLFGGWAGYLPHGSNFNEPKADQLYETVSTVFAPGAADALLTAALQGRS